MGKFERRKSRKSSWGIVLAVVAVGLLAALPVLWRLLPNHPEAASSETGITNPASDMSTAELSTTELPATESISETESTPESSETDPDFVSGEAVSFPLSLGDGSLQLESLFPFEGLNPDCGNLEGSEIAAVLVRNVSDQYLKSATILAVLRDGTKITFSLSDLPAGKEMLAFSVENAELEGAYECVAVEVETVFEETQSPEGIAVSAEGITVTLTNESQVEITGIDVYCHGTFGTGYYGGVTYVHTIEKLAPGESASIAVTECVLGMVEVARITVD